MTLTELLGRYVTDSKNPVDVNVKDLKRGHWAYIPGCGGLIPESMRNREVSHFEVETFDDGALFSVYLTEN